MIEVMDKPRLFYLLLYSQSRSQDLMRIYCDVLGYICMLYPKADVDKIRFDILKLGNPEMPFLLIKPLDIFSFLLCNDYGYFKNAIDKNIFFLDDTIFTFNNGLIKIINSSDPDYNELLIDVFNQR